MKHTVELLKKYGLTIDLSPEECTISMRDILEENEKESRLPITFCAWIDIMIEDASLFKKKFPLPSKYDLLTNKTIENLCFESKSENEFTFYNPEYNIKLKTLLLKEIEKNEEFYSQSIKKFKLKSIFSKGNSNQWLVQDLTQLVEELLIEPAIASPGKNLYQEMSICLLKDKEEYLVGSDFNH